MNNGTHPFTCNTCQVAFRSSDLQRTHMQSDWHRYNLKRRVASLPPLSSEVFNEKVLANRASAAATAARASFEKNCEACKKTFYSENAFVNHLSSQKHKSNVAKFGLAGKGDDEKSIMSSTFSLGETADKASTINELDSDAEDEFQDVIDGMKESSLQEDSEPVSRRPTRPHHSANGDEAQPDHPLSRSTTDSTTSRIRKRDPLKECLFCSHHDSETLDQCLDHMIKIHGLFIPEPNYVADMEGLVKYLNAKVNEEHQCLYCGRLKWSEDGIKTHMRDTNHCKIAYETEDAQLEIGQFYDFRSTYSDEEEEWSTDDEDEDMSDDAGAAPGGGVKLGAKRSSKTEGDDEEGEGWETDSTASSAPTDEIGRVYVDENRDEVRRRLESSKHHSSSSGQRHRSTDGFHSHAHHHTPNAVYYDDVEMHLPSGRTAGHRSLNKIWKQNLRTHPSPAEREQRLLTAGSDEEEKELRPSEAARERERGRGRDLVVRNEALGVAGLDDTAKRQLQTKNLKDQKRAAREQRKFQAKVSEKANSQKHFRDPLLQ
jgi:pre-60S factor REI1